MQKARTLATVHTHTHTHTHTGTSKNHKNRIFEIRNKGHPIKMVTI